MPKEPYKEPWELRSNTISVTMTDSEVEMLDKMAGSQGLTRSGFMRTLLYSAAQPISASTINAVGTDMEGRFDDEQK